jgi:hypothetical protein
MKLECLKITPNISIAALNKIKTMNKELINNNISEAICTIAIGATITEYGNIMLKDLAYNDLKQRANISVKSARRVQDWFVYNPNVGKHYEAIFKDQLNSDKTVLLTKLFSLVSKLEVEGLEFLIDTVEKAIDEPG